jgi:PPE-repeat protein
LGRWGSLRNVSGRLDNITPARKFGPIEGVEFLRRAASGLHAHLENLRLDRWIGERSSPIAVAAQAIVLVMTLFPPVTKPWWVPAAQQQATNAPLPAVAFVYDERFDASRHFPVFAVNREKLAWEWIITIVVAIGFGVLIWALRRRKAV